MADQPDYNGWQDWMRRARQENVHFIVDAHTDRRGVGRTSMALRIADQMEQNDG